MAATGLYVHIPFCLQKCHYCDFPSYPLRHLADEYLRAMAREAENYIAQDISVGTVFIGGGTPTCLASEELERLLALLQRSFFIAADAEFTVEANPGTVTARKLEVLKAGGVTRLSFGVQAFQPELLAKLGRRHTPADVYTGFRLARERGFANINLDLMSGLPGQSLAQWRETLDKAIALQPEHIAAYSLKVEEGTLFHRQMRAGCLSLPDEETDAAMTAAARERLRAAGFEHYEISNFAKPGCRSRHNLRYWRNETYIGIGCAAWSYWDGVRRGNVTGVADYIARMLAGQPATAEREPVTRQGAMSETMMLGLRLREGVSRPDFAARFGIDPLEAYPEIIAGLVRQKLIAVDAGRICLTERALPVGNLVFGAFV
ncbi:MAG TPA: radical SAM family heme chaperone HemW [Negativicutes bacterium]|nr:radical SAM family heme chaperone HemW [Negativicutes bacterium]